MYVVLGNVFLHLHPARLPRHAVKLDILGVWVGCLFLFCSTNNNWYYVNVLLQTYS